MWEMSSQTVDKVGDGLPKRWIRWEVGSHAGRWAPRIREMSSQTWFESSDPAVVVGDELPYAGDGLPTVGDGLPEFDGVGDGLPNQWIRWEMGSQTVHYAALAGDGLPDIVLTV